MYLSVIDEVPEESSQNAVTLRSTELAPTYGPGLYIACLMPTPLLLLVADQG